MKLLLLPLFFVIIYPLSSKAQTSKVKENKYRIDLPNYWGKGHKVWKVLTDKLPVVCAELENKELCGDDCNAKYVVEFYLTEPTVVDYSSKRIIAPVETNTRVLLLKANNFDVRSNNYSTFYPTRTSAIDSWQATANYYFQCYLLLRDNTGKLITTLILVDTNEVWERTYPKELPMRPSESDIEFNKEKYNPVIYDLLAIVERKILALKD